jgi:hypothetical protein
MLLAGKLMQQHTNVWKPLCSSVMCEVECYSVKYVTCGSLYTRWNLRAVLRSGVFSAVSVSIIIWWDILAPKMEAVCSSGNLYKTTLRHKAQNCGRWKVCTVSFYKTWTAWVRLVNWNRWARGRGLISGRDTDHRGSLSSAMMVSHLNLVPMPVRKRGALPPPAVRHFRIIHV